MKLLTFILLFINCGNFIFSQSYNKEINGKTQIYEVDSISQENIQLKAMSWIAINYKSANNVVQQSTPEKIIVKGSFTVPSKIPFPDMFNTITYFPVNINFDHTLIISIKDNRYKIDISFPETTKSITYLGKDRFYNINEYTLENKFTIDDKWATVRANLSKQVNGNEKKLKRKFDKYKAGGFAQAQFAYEKDVANKLNENIVVIFNGLSTYIMDKKDDW